MRRLWLAALLFSGTVSAHPLAPALLELRETAPRSYDVLWRTSVARAQRADVAPVLPPDCVEATARGVEPEDGGLAVRWSVHCIGGLAGKELAVSGLAGSGINVIVRITAADGATTTALLDAAQPKLVVAEAAALPPVFGAYLSLGVEHLLRGLDHLLFVAGLVLLLAGRTRVLVLTVTAFTLGHSATLSLATLGLVHVNSAAMELGIALSILVLAVELARPKDSAPSPIARYPTSVACTFGLLHGLGFASALAEVGLPQDQIPLALLAFNVGIELGQLTVVAGLLALATLSRLAPRVAATRFATIYVIGSLAAFWCFERAAG